MASKRDYILVAKSIVSAINKYKKEEEVVDTKLVASIVTSISDSFYYENENFNRLKFTNYILNGIRSDA